MPFVSYAAKLRRVAHHQAAISSNASLRVDLLPGHLPSNTSSFELPASSLNANDSPGSMSKDVKIYFLATTTKTNGAKVTKELTNLRKVIITMSTFVLKLQATDTSQL